MWGSKLTDLFYTAASGSIRQARAKKNPRRIAWKKGLYCHFYVPHCATLMT
jgi:hypothetical protein